MKIKNLNEDVYKEWKPDLRFKHIQSVLDKALNRGKYINNEREEVMAALDKADKGGYTKEQKKFIRDKHQQMWAKNRNVSESKELNEDYDSVFDKVHQYIYDLIQDTVIDNLAIVTASAVKEYNADWLDDNNLISQTNRAVTNLADILTKGLMAGYPEDLDESVKLKEANIDWYKNEPHDDYDASQFIGKPLKTFLKTIDHATKISISSEDGYDYYGNKGTTSGLSGRAHDAGWYLSDKIIKDINVPSDKKFYDYNIIIESVELTEKQWKHQLSSGIELRKQINSDDLDKQGVLDALDKCLYELKNILPEDDSFEVDDLLEEIEMIEVEDDDFEEHIDYILNELYDICDYNNIWIPLQ